MYDGASLALSPSSMDIVRIPSEDGVMAVEVEEIVFSPREEDMIDSFDIPFIPMDDDIFGALDD